VGGKHNGGPHREKQQEKQKAVGIESVRHRRRYLYSFLIRQPWR
jgi:hypothetical protein